MYQISRTKFNVSLLGEQKVGKTSIIGTLLGTPFRESQLMTIGIENYLDEATFDGVKFQFKIFDTAGQERYSSISSNTIKYADGFLLVFSVDKKQSLEKISQWIENIDKNANIKEKVIILIGNKIDIDKREVSEEEGKKFAKEQGFKYFETSAKTNVGIKEAFNEIYKDIYELDKKLDANDESFVHNTRKKSFLISSKKSDQKELEKKKGNCC